MAFGNQNQAGFLNQVFAAIQAGDVFINKTGIFIYNGTPALGNTPIIWLTPTAVSVDPFGNVLPTSGGIVSFSSPFFSQLNSGQLSFVDSSFIPAQKAGINLAGVGPATQALLITSGKVSTDKPAAIELVSSVTPQILGLLNAIQVFLVEQQSFEIDLLFVTTGQVLIGANPGSAISNTGALIEIETATGNPPAIAFPAGGTAVTSTSKWGQVFGAPSSLGTLNVNDGNDGVNYDIQRHTNTLPTPGQLFNSVTPAVLAGLGFSNLAINTVYRVRGVLYINPTTAANTYTLQWITNAGGFNVFLCGYKEFNAPQAASGAMTTGNGEVSNGRTQVFTGSTFTANDKILEIDATLVTNATTAQTMIPEMACTVAADTFTVLAGSWLKLEPVTAR